MKLSTLARPPIQSHEIDGAPLSVCPNHGGLIRVTGDTEGRVFFCPLGREYFRFSKTVTGMNSPLNYQHERPI